MKNICSFIYVSNFMLFSCNKAASLILIHFNSGGSNIMVERYHFLRKQCDACNPNNFDIFFVPWFYIFTYKFDAKQSLSRERD